MFRGRAFSALSGVVGTTCVALALVVPASGCASSTSAPSTSGSIKSQASAPGVVLKGDTQTTGGKALFFTASTAGKLAREPGGLYAVELRGIDLKRAHRATFTRPDYLDRHRCDTKPCAWTVIPGTASTYEFRAFLIDLRSNKSVSQSQPARLVCTSAPRRHALKFLVNGKIPPTTPL